MERPKFTFEEAFSIQNGNLYRWKSKLNAETYEALKDHVLSENAELREISDPSPYDVFRGQDLSIFVERYVPRSFVESTEETPLHEVKLNLNNLTEYELEEILHVIRTTVNSIKLAGGVSDEISSLARQVSAFAELIGK